MSIQKYVKAKCIAKIIKGGKKWKYTIVKVFTTCKVVWHHLNVSCNKLKMYTIHPKVTSKITKSYS